MKSKKTEFIIITFSILIILFASSGCMKKTQCSPDDPKCANTLKDSDARRECASDFCYCQVCEKGEWLKVNKAENNINSWGDCADYCERTGSSPDSDKGYSFVCSDIVSHVAPKCNCPNGYRCCRVKAYKAENQCIDITDFCPYTWQPDELCSS
ncbi:MAG: hypothetical protein NTV63_04665 [Candidatus Woesearchaeota archaeon]|nr:hypothetical protein [Candidatus Woesearchaeota archaeon]